MLAGDDNRWPFLLALTAVPCLISLVVLPFFSDSPSYVLVDSNDEHAAVKGEQKYIPHIERTCDMWNICVNVHLLSDITIICVNVHLLSDITMTS